MKRWLAAVALLAALPASAAPTLRIVSLAPNLTELVYAAGAGDRLVGTSDYSDYPAAARALPRVGDAWRVDMERVVELHPTVVLVWPSGTPAAVVDRLRQLGLRTVTVPTYRLADVPAALRAIGALAGTAAVGESAAQEFEREIAAQRSRAAGRAVLTVFVELDDQPLYTVNSRHVISEIVELCGGRNVFADLPQLAPPVAQEAVLARDPQVILTTDDTIADPRELWAPWPRLTAVRSGTIYSLKSDLITRSTPRLAQGVKAVCDALEDARARLANARRK